MASENSNSRWRKRVGGMVVGEEDAEVKIPVLSVLKNGALLKNIFLNSPPPELFDGGDGEERDGDDEEPPILIGRHPDCHVVVDHPSISRFHLEVRARRRLRRLTITDRSSVHGTWISGRKIPSGIPIDVGDGALVKLGASTREYRVQWLTLGEAYEMENPLPSVPEEREESNQEDAGLLLSSDEINMRQAEVALDPPLQEFMEPLQTSNYSPLGKFEQIRVTEELTAEHLCFCCDPAVHEFGNCPSPYKGEARIAEAASNKSSTMISERQGKSASLLSRRPKSKSISSLRVHTGRSPEGMENSSCLSPEEYREGETTDQICPEEKEDPAPNMNQRNCELSAMNSFVMDNLTVEDSAEETVTISVVLFENADGNGLEVKEDSAPDMERETHQVLLNGEMIHSNCTLIAMNSSFTDNSLVEESAEKMETTSVVLFDDTDEICSKEKEVDMESETHQVLLNGVMNHRNCSLSTMNSFIVDNSTADDFAEGMENISVVLFSKADEICHAGKEYFVPAMGGRTQPVLFESDSLQSTLTLSTLYDSIVEDYCLEMDNLASNDPIPGNANNNFDMKHAIFPLNSSTRKECENTSPESFVSDKENMTPQVSGKGKCHPFVNSSPLLSTSRRLFDDENLVPQEDAGRDVDSGNVEKEATIGVNESLALDAAFWIDSSTPRVPTAMKLDQFASQNSPSRGMWDISVHLSDKKGVALQEEFSSDKENVTPMASRSGKLRRRALNCLATQKEMKTLSERIPFQAVCDNSPLKIHSSVGDVKAKNNILNVKDGGCKLPSQLLKQAPPKSGEPRRVWSMVADVSCLLDSESMKSIKLLAGLNGTRLIIPRIVIRELDSMSRRDSLFRKSSKASSALHWIEECMRKETWWIHVQNSSETVPAAQTPPITPTSPLCHESTFCQLGSISCGSFSEILSPTPDDHILDCALLFKNLRGNDSIALLSNRTTLKIKAMAEGLICETATDFRESLVNPLSKRFMWSGSSPRGTTWSWSELSRAAPMKTLRAADDAKGLKLLLLHSSLHRQQVAFR